VTRPNLTIVKRSLEAMGTLGHDTAEETTNLNRRAPIYSDCLRCHAEICYAPSLHVPYRLRICASCAAKAWASR
jgi:hypothetical protein